MTATSATVDYPKAIEACRRADWMLAQAYVLLVPPCHASLLIEGAEPEAVLEALEATIREVQTLLSGFTAAAQGAHP